MIDGIGQGEHGRARQGTGNSYQLREFGYHVGIVLLDVVPAIAVGLFVAAIIFKVAFYLGGK